MTAPIPIGPTLNQIGQIFVNVKDLDAALGLAREWIALLPDAIVEVRPLVTREQ